MDSYSDIELNEAGIISHEALRLSPSALAEIIETYQKLHKSTNLKFFGTLMGEVNIRGEYLISSVVCLYYELTKAEDGSQQYIVGLPKNYLENIVNHENLFGARCLGTFLVNAPSDDVVIGTITQQISNYMRSKMVSQIENLCLKIEIDPKQGYYLEAIKMVPNKFSVRSFVNTFDIPVKVDYIQENDRHVFHNLYFYQMEREYFESFEIELLNRLIKTLNGTIQEEEDDYGTDTSENFPIEISQKLKDKIYELLVCRKRLDSKDLNIIQKDFSQDREKFEKLFSSLEKQMKLTRCVATLN